MTSDPLFRETIPVERRPLWKALGPPLLLFLLEMAGFAVARAQEPLGVTRYSLGVALSVLITGLLVVSARPTPETRLAGVLSILLASLLAVPFEIGSVELNPPGLLLAALPFQVLLRYFNGIMVIVVGLHLAARFPPRSPRLRRRAPTDRMLFVYYIVTVLLATGMLFTTGRPLRVVVGSLGIVWMICVLVQAHRQLFLASQQMDGAYRRAAQQARLILFGFFMAEAPLLLRLLAFGLGWGRIISYNTALTFQIFVPLTVAYAVIRHDLFDIDAALRRALAYTAVIAVLLGVYFALTMVMIALMTAIVFRFTGVAVLSVLLVAAIVFRPLYAGLQRFVDRIFYPERLRFAAEIAAARRALQQVVGRERVIALLEKGLPARLDIVWASLVLAPAQDVPGRSDPPPVWNGRLVVGDRVLGRYWLGPRRSGLPFDASEQAQLQAVISQAALALAYAETLDELNELNRTLEQEVAMQTAQVLAQQRALAVAEERQRLARDLHDSVTQTLFSISLGSRALRKIVGKDAATAEAGLAEQEAAAQEALAEMRALLAQLRSPVVADGDLVQAVRHHCDHLQQQVGLQVHLDAPDTLSLSPETATELLFVVKEALHNAVKYAGVETARCTIAAQEGALHLTVEDDGVGFDAAELAPSLGSGLGLRNMQERVEKLGGVLAIDSVPGQGTRVTVRAPMDREGERVIG